MSFDGKFMRGRDVPPGSFVFARNSGDANPYLGFIFGWEANSDGDDPDLLVVDLSEGRSFRDLHANEPLYVLQQAGFSTAGEATNLDFSGSYRPGQIASGPAGHFLVISHHGKAAYVHIGSGMVASRGMPDVRGAISAWRVVQGPEGHERVLAAGGVRAMAE